VADAWPPYNITPDTDDPGYIIEIAKNVFDAAGYRVEYIKMPWTRAVKDTRRGQFHGIIGATVADAPDFIFPEHEQGVSEYVFYTLKSSDWVYKGLPSLEGKLLGVVSDYSYSEQLDAYIKAHNQSERVQVIYGQNPLEQNLNKLLANRISVFIDDRTVTEYVSTGLKVREQIRAAGVVSSMKIYIAFSPNNDESQKYAKILSDGMLTLRRTGKLQEILAKYQIADWAALPPPP